MQPLIVLEQGLNGLAFGIMLFLMAGGLTLIFGVMNVVNMAHGSLYMMGAYVSAAAFAATGSFGTALLAALAATFVLGIVVELIVVRPLYNRDHLSQVLATFGLILVFNEVVRVIWGPMSLHAAVPKFLDGQVEILPGAPYPAYRLAVIVVGLLAALALYLIVAKTRIGMLIRAGASNRTMVSALGININLLYTFVFGLGAMLAGLSGLMAAPIFTVEPGMGDNVLILAFVVIVVGGMGSIRGAFVASLLIGVVDTMGRALLRPLLATVLGKTTADSAGPALASMLIYVLMALVLIYRPQGLLPTQGR
jgi:branched-chain amino acid transport system permease protein